MATTVRVIAADPTSTALLVAAVTGVVPARRATHYSALVTVGDGPALLCLAPLGGATRASLTVAGSSRRARRLASLDFLTSLAGAAEARADAA